jgi:hypothetical protein
MKILAVAIQMLFDGLKNGSNINKYNVEKIYFFI